MIHGELRYTDRRGASVVKFGDAVTLARRLKTLRTEAELLVDGQRVGACAPMDWADDARVKWNWWYDPDAVGETR